MSATRRGPISGCINPNEPSAGDAATAAAVTVTGVNHPFAGRRAWSPDSAWRLILPTGLALCLFALVIFQLVLPAQENAVMDKKREMIQELTRIGYNVLSYYEEKSRLGVLTEREAQAQALELLRGFRYGPEGKDYFWINDNGPRMIMHPYRPDLEGRDVSDYADPSGKKLFVTFVRVARTQGAGFVDYLWQWMDEPGRVAPKVSYVREFRPWGWIIGTGIYIEDVRAEMASMKRRLTLVLFGIAAIIALLSAYLIAQNIRTGASRRRAEEARQESEGRFRTLVENSQVGVLVLQKGRVIYMNPEQRRLFGSPPDPFWLNDYRDAPAEDLEKLSKLNEELFPENGPALEMELRLFPFGAMAAGLDMRWVHCRANPIVIQGEKGLLAVMLDTTKAKELERLLLAQDKMASLGRVAAGIAHEIRNPLSGINLYLSALEEMFADESRPAEDQAQLRRIFGNLNLASQKIEKVIKRVLDFSRPTKPRLTWVQVNQILEQALEFSAVTFRKNGIRVKKSLALDLPLCHLDPHLLEQVLMNLITNAVQVLQAHDGERTILASSSLEEDKVVLRVADSGPGVPPEIRDRIFDPFFTLNKDGAGIGLSLSRRIVADHGGTLAVAQSRWGGAEFIITLPALYQVWYQSVG
ncbi:MAG: cache domain-containing protein [Pseudomonadota bacterium]